jgi:hypothetical protein
MGDSIENSVYRNGNRFAPGHPGFRKGAPGKFRGETKAALTKFVMEKVNELPELWNQLKDREKIRLFVDLLPYVVSKATTNIAIEQPAVDLIQWENLSDETLSELLKNVDDGEE